MAVAPLFVADMLTLKTALRLEGARAAGSLAEIDQAVMEVRIRFYRALGKSAIDTILATTAVDDPDTDEEIKRAAANSCEIALVRSLLLRRKPLLFVDGSGNRHNVFNDEGAFEAANRRQIEDEIKRLDLEIQEWLELLAGDQDLSDETTVNVDTIGPEETSDLPGASIWPAFRGENRG